MFDPPPPPPPKQTEIAPKNVAPDYATDIGQVARLALPEGFVEGKERSGEVGNNHFKDYHLANDPEIQLYFQYRGHRINRAAAGAFRDLLAKQTGTVSADELKKIREVLDDKSNPKDFRVDLAKTQDINGKRVLIVEGFYRLWDLRARTVFVDADETGSVVQEITFQVPSSKIGKHYASGVKALESIQWK